MSPCRPAEHGSYNGWTKGNRDLAATGRAGAAFSWITDRYSST